MTVSFSTLGCKVNQYESEAMAELFTKRGYTVLPPDSPADITIVNSCTVTSESSRKTRQTVRKLRKAAPDTVLLLTGCMAEAFPAEAEKIKEADIIIGNGNYLGVVDICENYIKTRERYVNVEPHFIGEKYCPLSVERFEEHTRSYIKIEDGCDRFCSYCIIPFARGRVRSRDLGSIEKEAEALAGNGYKEVVLTGINLSAYGTDTGLELCDAVDAASGPDGIKRVRLGSLECDQISNKALNRLAGNPKFCPQFHLSLQSGCDKTLTEMNRRYDTAFYRDLVKRIRERFSNASITTDIMVGFAGETNEDFNKSCDFVREIGFARSHIFIYSVREGTRAAKRNDFVDPSVAASRSRIMQEICLDCEQKFLTSQIGRTVYVLFETDGDGFSEGYSENYTRVKVRSKKPLEGLILPVVITEASGDFCTGELKDN